MPIATQGPPDGPGPTTGGDAFTIPLAGPADEGGGTTQFVDFALAAALISGLGVFLWSVPGLALSVPGLIVILTILAQAAGGLAWLPLVKRKIGSLGTGHRGELAPRR